MTEVAQTKTGIDASGNETKHVETRETDIDVSTIYIHHPSILPFMSISSSFCSVLPSTSIFSSVLFFYPSIYVHLFICLVFLSFHLRPSLHLSVLAFHLCPSFHVSVLSFLLPPSLHLSVILFFHLCPFLTRDVSEYTSQRWRYHVVLNLICIYLKLYYPHLDTKTSGGRVIGHPLLPIFPRSGLISIRLKCNKMIWYLARARCYYQTNFQWVCVFWWLLLQTWRDMSWVWRWYRERKFIYIYISATSTLDAC